MQGPLGRWTGDTRLRAILSLPLALVAATLVAGSATAERSAAPSANRKQDTRLISRSFRGGVPNGPSGHAVISGDRRFARIIAFDSRASNLVHRDKNGTSDVFIIKRARPFGNKGSRWTPGSTKLISRGVGGAPANGPSFLPSVGGNLRTGPRCVAFLSAASNLVADDTNGKFDAFVTRGPGGAPRRVSLPGGAQASEHTSAVAVSGDCSRIAFVTGGRLYVRRGAQTIAIPTGGPVSDPSFASGAGNDLVFATPAGVLLSPGGTGAPRLVAPGGRNPVYSGRRGILAYEATRAGRTQIVTRDLSGRERVISRHGQSLGNTDSRAPVIGNSGYYVAFESAASNLGTTADRARGDRNGRPDVYLYTDVRKLTLVQSVRRKGVPLAAGGRNPSMSFYANYILFESAGRRGVPRVYMRYLGPV
jgi:hypothetical protein